MLKRGMKLATLLPRGDDPRASARLARSYDDAGVDVFGVGEDPLADLRRLRAILDR